ncbi:MAG: hypothetical protein JNG84_08340 [Archangium sp.]|nr:hypothetical protein [Archangium sp.]
MSEVSRSLARWALSALVAVAAWRCVPPRTPASSCFTCTASGACPAGYSCIRQMCVADTGDDACQTFIPTYQLTPPRGPVGTVVTITGSDVSEASEFFIAGARAPVLDRGEMWVKVLVMPGTTSGAVDLVLPSGRVSTNTTFEREATSVPVLRAATRATASEGTTGAELGVGVALSAAGDVLLAGAPRDAASLGGAWAFVREGGAWVQQGPKLLGNDSKTAVAAQGISVALSALGETAAVAGTGSSNGGAWAYERDAGGWAQVGQALFGPARPSTYEGYAVALSVDGRTLLSSTLRTDGDIPESYSTARIFTRDDAGAWQRPGLELRAPSRGYANNCSGLSADGTRAMMCAFRPATGFSGAWVFSLGSAGWTLESPLLTGQVDGGVPSTRGFASLSGDGATVVVVGTRSVTSDGGIGGSAWVFHRSADGGWQRQGPQLDFPDDVRLSPIFPSVAVSTEGDWFIAGGVRAGVSVAVQYVRTEETWALAGAPVTVGTGGLPGSQFGGGVAISLDGRTVAMGSPGDMGSRGAVWILAQPE